LHEVAPRLLDGTGVTVRRVVLWETENCYTEASLDVGERPAATPALGGVRDADD
jgi:hypothetical protein